MKKILFISLLFFVTCILQAQTTVTTTGGTASYVTKFSGTYTVVNSSIYDNGTIIGIGGSANSVGIGTGTSTPACKFNVLDGKIATYSPTAMPTPSFQIDNFNNSGNDLQYSSLGFKVKGTIGGNTPNGAITLVQPLNANKNGDFTFTLRNYAGSNNEIMRIKSEGYVGIGTTTPAANLDVQGSSGTTLKIVDSNQGSGKILTSDANGVASWQAPVSSSTAWQLLGNAGTTAGTNFMGTTDNIDVVFKRNNVQAGLLSTSNTFWGVSAGNAANASGINNIFVGNNAGTNNTYAKDNTAIGVDALSTQSYANGNTAWSTFNVAVGNGALKSNNPTSSTNGFYNVSVGYQSGYANTTGYYNTFIGTKSGYHNTTGYDNSFLGMFSGYSNTTGYHNTFSGINAGYYNTTALRNTFVGNTAGYTQSGSDCNDNTCIGYAAGINTTTGYGNTVLGSSAGEYNTTGYYNTVIGYGADADDNNYHNSTALGSWSTINASNKIRFGDANVTVVEGPVSYTTSDGRFKINVKEEVKGLEFIKKLRPVNYQLDTKAFTQFLIKNKPDSIKTKRMNGIDYTASTSIIHSGFIAQEVEQAAKDCGFTTDIVHAPADGNDNYSVAYGAIVVPLVKAVQELDKMVDSLKSEVAILKSAEQRTNQYNNEDQDILETTLQVNLTSNDQIILYQNEPNPTDKSTVIRYSISANITGNAYIMFFDVYGNELKKVEINERGFGKIEVNTENLAYGIYTYSLVIDGKSIDTMKMIRSK